ncbi:MAG: NAD(P)/FAD-dependent oxidoreductase [Myxococcales bacterium]|nr:NAD(P)/FAD-dependent oxidoreductase [Myxococcales bacterium]
MGDPRNHVLIVGSGFSGLGMAVRLKQAGVDFTILEKADEVGGTWRDNHYPGAACDVPSHLYSFSFERWPGWSRMYGPQREIFEYMRHCARKYGLYPHVQLGAQATSATFDPREGLWKVTTEDGREFRGRALVSGTGALSRPSIPELPGLASFEGAAFHSARWDHAYPLEGKRVAVVGTGASAIQFVPQIAPKVGRLLLFQRTPPWILPKPDFAFSERERALFENVPGLSWAFRQFIWARQEIGAVPMVIEPRLGKLIERLALRFLEKQVPDPALRKRLTPSYRIGCKRILLTNDYYPALGRENVDLITDGIERVDATGLHTVDGKHHEVDAILFGTGFQAADAVCPYPVLGRDGRSLDAAWQRGAEAYLGTTVSGFPNLYLLMGPNTGLGHNSMIYMIEAQIEHAYRCIERVLSRDLSGLDVRPEVQASYNEELQRRLARTVWASGCRSWYQNKEGKNVTLWPGFTFEFRLRAERPDFSHYEELRRAG